MGNNGIFLGDWGFGITIYRIFKTKNGRKYKISDMDGRRIYITKKMEKVAEKNRQMWGQDPAYAEKCFEKNPRLKKALESRKVPTLKDLPRKSAFYQYTVDEIRAHLWQEHKFLAI